MSKRGQIFIFTALLLCSFLFISIIGLSPSFSSKDRFSVVYENFIIESSYLLNACVYLNCDVIVVYDDFLEDFNSYANSFSSDLGLVVFYEYVDGNVYAFNRNHVDVTLNGAILKNNTFKNMGDVVNIVLIDEYEHLFKIDSSMVLYGLFSYENFNGVEVKVKDV